MDHRGMSFAVMASIVADALSMIMHAAYNNLGEHIVSDGQEWNAIVTTRGHTCQSAAMPDRIDRQGSGLDHSRRGVWPATART
jgi:hypothetical protein